jgi:hypothetical protein
MAPSFPLRLRFSSPHQAFDVCLVEAVAVGTKRLRYGGRRSRLWREGCRHGIEAVVGWRLHALAGWGKRILKAFIVNPEVLTNPALSIFTAAQPILVPDNQRLGFRG